MFLKEIVSYGNNLLFSVAHAADGKIEVPNTGGPSSVPQLFSNIVSTLLFFVGALAVIFVIVGGIQYITSSGDPKRIEQAKNTLTYAVAGLVIAILSFAIVSFVRSQLGK